MRAHATQIPANSWLLLDRRQLRRRVHGRGVLHPRASASSGPGDGPYGWEDDLFAGLRRGRRPRTGPRSRRRVSGDAAGRTDDGRPEDQEAPPPGGAAAAAAGPAASRLVGGIVAVLAGVLTGGTGAAARHAPASAAQLVGVSVLARHRRQHRC